MEAQTIQTLVSCDERELVQIARKLHLVPSTAKTIRFQFLRQLSGQCSICEKPVGPVGVCYRCRKQYPDRSLVGKYPVKILKELEPGSHLATGTCSKCQTSFPVTVEMTLLNMQNSTPRIPDLCTRCWHKEKRDRDAKSAKGTVSLTFRPFRALPDLSIIAQGPKTGQNCENRAGIPA